MLKKLLISFSLLLLSFQAWGATGSAAADTWYVRPVEDCENNGDGLAFGCAASAGATGAFKGFANLIWTSTTGIDDGDTLKICGAFYDSSSKTSGVRMLSIEGSGGSGVDLIADGDCSANMTNPGVWTNRRGVTFSGAILDGGGTVDHGIRTLANTNIKFRNLRIRNFDQRGMVLYNNATTDITIAKFITVEASVLVTGIRNASLTANGIDARGSDITIDGPTVSDIGEDAIYLKGARQTVTNLDVINPSQDGVLGDCLQFDAEINGTVITDLYCDHRNKDSKQCLVANGFTDTPTWGVNGVTCLMPTSAGSAIGVLLEGTSVSAKRIYVEGGNYGIFAQNVAGNNVTVTGSVVRDTTTACVASGASPDSFTVQHNTLHNCGTTGIDFSSATNGRIAQNNMVTGSMARGINKGTSGTTESYNNIYGPTDRVLSNGAPTSAGTGDLNSAPNFTGGTSPTTAAGFRLSAASPSRRAGTELNIGNVQDHGNRAFAHPPSIGAWEAASNDTASSRTTASTRTVRN